MIGIFPSRLVLGAAGECPIARKLAKRLLLNDAAGDARTRVACGVGFIVVCLFMNHNRRTTFVKERVRPIPESSVRIHKRRLNVSAGLHLDVEQVSGMRTFGIVFSVFPRSRVEMSSRAQAIGPLPLPHGMN